MFPCASNTILFGSYACYFEGFYIGLAYIWPRTNNIFGQKYRFFFYAKKTLYYVKIMFHEDIL